jgi:hypothetical protein
LAFSSIAACIDVFPALLLNPSIFKGDVCSLKYSNLCLRVPLLPVDTRTYNYIAQFYVIVTKNTTITQAT